MTINQMKEGKHMFQKSILSLMALFLLLFSGCAELNYDKLASYLEEKPQKVYKSDKDVLMFILDGSGSMTGRDGSGKVKIVAAKDMLKDISSQLDSNKTNVGLISFNDGCHSTELLIEPSNNDFDHVVKVSSAISPSGKTPLAASIRKAGDVLKNIDKKVNIIIISDGVETCGGDPVAEAKRLKSKYGIDAHIYVIGYSVDGSTKRALERLAQAGGGSYYSADDSVALDKIITTITDELDIKADNWEGNTFKFKINFDSGSAKLKKEYYPQVKQLATYLKKTGYAAELQGHTDSSGSKKANQRLSQKRAQSVVDKLVEYGVDKDKVYAVGFGELAPIATNKTKEGRFENRRVEAHIIKNGKMDISYINQANAKNVVNVKYADNNSFIGYYKVLDPYRSYDEYHVWMELYANGRGYFSEYDNNKKLTKRGEESLAWDYSRTKHIISLDYSDHNKKPGWAEFTGRVSGNTNDFRLTGHWGNGKPATVVMIRITQEELECMKKSGKFVNGTCSR
jgi:outer membrane protein OmpA-like peptidoglycan-associated protein